MLVFPHAESRRQPVVGMVSGTDEWGQSMLISATEDGAVVRWQLPNGACAEADDSLAKELSPLLGLEMLCNRRFALVVSKVSRIMVLDTWKMQLLYCVDTAQEQIRRSVAVGELSMSRPKSPRRRVVRSTNASKMETKSRGGNVDREVVERGRVSPSRSSPAGGAKCTVTLPLSNHAATKQQTQRWDAVVISLGADGLVKCFLWTQPRGSTSSTSCNVTSGGVSAHNTWGFRWVQRSTWVISWADQAEDITCSQSTSLKDGDNLNPQTALMGSIKNSYFPHSVKMSPDSSLVLLVWRTKFVVLKRSWLCSLESCSDDQALSERSGKSSTAGVGSCRVSPAEFLRQAAETHGSKDPDTCNNGGSSESVNWEDGKFLENGNIVLWTNTGQVLQFLPAESSAKTAGKLFLFTKDQDQLVPRSDSKDLGDFKEAVYVTSMDCRACCQCVLQKDDRSQTKLKRLNALLAEGRRHPGYMSCIGSGSSASESTVQIVHTCYRGTVRRRTMPMASIPSPRRVLHNSEDVIVARMHLAEKTWFHSLTDGYEAAAKAARDESSDKDSTDKKTCYKSQRRHCLTHFIIGREETQSSSPFEVAWRAGVHHKRQRSPDDALLHSAELPIITDTVAPFTERGGVRSTEDKFDQLEVDGTDQKEYEYSEYRYLLDVPIIVKGFSDGRIVIELLSQEHLSSEYGGVLKDAATRLSCHSGKVTALAHCCLGVEFATSSCPKAASSCRTSTDILKETCFATTRNPFYRARFPDLALAGNSNKRQVVFNSGHRSSFTMKVMLDDHGTLNELFSDAASNHPALKFVLFSGASDGVLCVVELILYHPATRDESGRSVQHAARISQKFRNHRGAIHQISLSPIKGGIIGSGGEIWDAEYPDRWIATAGADCKVVVYAPQYLRKSSSRHSKARSTLTQRSEDRFCVEWMCVFQLSEHADSIRNLDWHLESGLLYVHATTNGTRLQH
uniref:Uncharacterized protein n=1 Tax=Hyaloperonospora arabidopsidis (strain Emoy2) TaxID=559515 RepID=M4BBF6_HYAAE